jgi:hypothetical protein
LPPLFEWAADTVAATLAFLIVLAAAVLLHRSAHFLQNQLPKFCIWLIYGAAGVLFLLDVAGFVLLVLPAFWDLIPQKLQALVRAVEARPRLGDVQ